MGLFVTKGLITVTARIEVSLLTKKSRRLSIVIKKTIIYTDTYTLMLTMICALKCKLRILWSSHNYKSI